MYWERGVSQYEVIRTIVLEDSPCCEIPHNMDYPPALDGTRRQCWSAAGGGAEAARCVRGHTSGWVGGCVCVGETDEAEERGHEQATAEERRARGDEEEGGGPAGAPRPASVPAPPSLSRALPPAPPPARSEPAQKQAAGGGRAFADARSPAAAAAPVPSCRPRLRPPSLSYRPPRPPLAGGSGRS